MDMDTRARVMLASAAPLAAGMAGTAGPQALLTYFVAGHTAIAVVWLVVALTMAGVAVAVTITQWRAARDRRGY